MDEVEEDLLVQHITREMKSSYLMHVNHERFHSGPRNVMITSLDLVDHYELSLVEIT